MMDRRTTWWHHVSMETLRLVWLLCTCSRMRQISRWVSTAWSRPQFPEVSGAMTNSSSEADWLSWEQRPTADRLLIVLCWKELMLMDREERWRWVSSQVTAAQNLSTCKLTHCLLVSGCPNRKCHHPRWSHVTGSRSCPGLPRQPESPLMRSSSSGRGRSEEEHITVLRTRDQTHLQYLCLQVFAYLQIFVYQQVCLPSGWWPGAGSDGQGLSAPSQTDSGSVASSPALPSGPPTWGPGPFAGHRWPPTSLWRQQQLWWRMAV